MFLPTPPRESETLPGTVECSSRLLCVFGACAMTSMAADPMTATFTEAYALFLNIEGNEGEHGTDRIL